MVDKAKGLTVFLGRPCLVRRSLESPLGGRPLSPLPLPDPIPFSDLMVLDIDLDRDLGGVDVGEGDGSVVT